MTRPVLALLLFTACPLLHATEDAAPPTAHDMLRARLAEASQPGAVKTPAAAPVGAPITETARAVVEAANEKKAGATGAPATKTEVQKQPANVLPKVEVNRRRITVLDVQLAKQDEQIAREKKNGKMTEVDKALNDSKIAKPLAMFGGESAQFRKQASNQRVALMEDEKDILEAMAHAKTKAEKAELQKELDALRAERREIEQAMR